jgi:hypothetical protein
MAPVQFRLGGTSGAGATHLDMVATDKPVIPVDPLVPPLPAGGTFSGRLILTATGAGVAAAPTPAPRPRQHGMFKQRAHAKRA